MEALATLKPAFMPGMGTVTAGNSSPLNDGAAGLLIMSDAKAKQLDLKPLVRVVASAAVNRCCAYGFGFVGNGCVGHVFSPGIFDCGTGRSSRPCMGPACVSENSPP